MARLDHLKHFARTAFLSLAPVLLLPFGVGGPYAHFACVLLGLGLATYGAHGCAHSSPPVVAFGHCSTAAVTNTAEGLLGAVTTALATGDYVDQLAVLATQWGAAEVGCAVDLVIAEFTHKAAIDSQSATILKHAQDWRLSHP